MTSRSARLILFALGLVGCASQADHDLQTLYGANVDPEPRMSNQQTHSMDLLKPSNADCVDTPAFEDVAAFDTCVHCHASTHTGAARSGAPMSVNFDSKAAADKCSALAASMVMSGVMPPRSSGLTLTAAEKQQLYDWAMCSM